MYCRVPIGNGGDAADNFLLSFRARWAWGKQSKSKTETTFPPLEKDSSLHTASFKVPCKEGAQESKWKLFR